MQIFCLEEKMKGNLGSAEQGHTDESKEGAKESPGMEEMDGLLIDW